MGTFEKAAAATSSHYDIVLECEGQTLMWNHNIICRIYNNVMCSKKHDTISMFCLLPITGVTCFSPITQT